MQRTAGISDQQGSDFLFFHEAERLHGQFVGGDGSGVRVHGVAGGFAQCVGAVTLQQPAQVAVADDAEQASALFYGGHAEFFAGHFVNHVFHRRGGLDAGDGVAGVHQLIDARETLAELAAGVQGGEIFGAESFFERDGDGECIAERKHGCSGGGGREAEPTCFCGNAAIERDVAGASEGGLGVAAKADERVADALDVGEQAKNFFSLAAGRERDDDVAPGQHAKIAVDGFGGMQKERGAAGGAEGGGDFLGDDAAFAHSGNDDAAAAFSALQNAGDGAVEIGGHGAFEPVGEGEQSLGLNAHEPRWSVMRQTGRCYQRWRG